MNAAIKTGLTIATAITTIPAHANSMEMPKEMASFYGPVSISQQTNKNIVFYRTAAGEIVPEVGGTPLSELMIVDSKGDQMILADTAESACLYSLAIEEALWRKNPNQDPGTSYTSFSIVNGVESTEENQEELQEKVRACLGVIQIKNIGDQKRETGEPEDFEGLL